jgi:hypothetical protein
VPLLEAVEKAKDIRYVQSGRSDTDVAKCYSTVTALPNLEAASAASAVNCTTFLICHPTEVISSELLRLVRSLMRKQFKKIKAFYVGQAAERMLDSGKRLTMAVQSPRTFVCHGHSRFFKRSWRRITDWSVSGSVTAIDRQFSLFALDLTKRSSWTIPKWSYIRVVNLIANLSADTTNTEAERFSQLALRMGLRANVRSPEVHGVSREENGIKSVGCRHSSPDSVCKRKERSKPKR